MRPLFRTFQLLGRLLVLCLVPLAAGAEGEVERPRRVWEGRVMPHEMPHPAPVAEPEPTDWPEAVFCVPAAGDPLLKKAGLYGCLTRLRLGVMMMVPNSGEHGRSHEGLWNQGSDLLVTTVVEWPTPPCTVGDSQQFAPQMGDAGTHAWMAGKSHGTWWCAQRGHLLGVQRLVKAVPDAHFYLLIDADTQGSSSPDASQLPSPPAHSLLCLRRSLSPRRGLASRATGAPHLAAGRRSLHGTSDAPRLRLPAP